MEKPLLVCITYKSGRSIATWLSEIEISRSGIEYTLAETPSDINQSVLRTYLSSQNIVYVDYILLLASEYDDIESIHTLDVEFTKATVNGHPFANKSE